MRRSSVLLLLLVCALPVAAGGIYKWVDKEGRVHFGDHPEGGGASQEIQLHDNPNQGIGVDAEQQEEQQRLLRAFDEERTQQQTEQKTQQAEKAQRERKCAWARDRLRRYQESSRIYDLDAQGNRRILNDAEHAATMKKAEEEVQHWCN